MLSATTFYPSSSVLNIWTSLLAHLQSLHPTLPTILTSKIISRLGAPTEPNAAAQKPDADIVLLDADEEREKQRQDASYDRCVAGWANWLVDTYSRRDDEDEDDEGDTSIDRTDVVLKHVSALGPTKSVSGTREKTSVPSHSSVPLFCPLSFTSTQRARPFARPEQGPTGTRESVCPRAEYTAAHVVWGTSACYRPTPPSHPHFPAGLERSRHAAHARPPHCAAHRVWKGVLVTHIRGHASGDSDGGSRTQCGRPCGFAELCSSTAHWVEESQSRRRVEAIAHRCLCTLRGRVNFLCYDLRGSSLCTTAWRVPAWSGGLSI